MSLKESLKASETIEEDSVINVPVANSSQILVTTHRKNTECLIWVFDLDVSSEPYLLRGHTHAMWSLATEGQYLLSGANDKILLWDLTQR
jgi:hypothetical protein